MNATLPGLEASRLAHALRSLVVVGLLLVARTGPAQIRVTEARIGCLPIQRTDNLTALVRSSCDGQMRCKFKAPSPAVYGAMGIRAAGRPFCTQGMEIRYDCGDARVHRELVAGDAWDHPPAVLACPVPRGTRSPPAVQRPGQPAPPPPATGGTSIRPVGIDCPLEPAPVPLGYSPAPDGMTAPICTAEKMNALMNLSNADDILDCQPPGSVVPLNIPKAIQIRGTSGIHLDCGGGTLGTGCPDQVALQILSTQRQTGPVHECNNRLCAPQTCPGMSGCSQALDGTMWSLANWDVAHNVAITNCNIAGFVIVRAEINVATCEYAQSTRCDDHATRIRQMAPHDILFDRLSFQPNGVREANVLYLHEGVSQVTVTNSDFGGQSRQGAAIYLDAETRRNVIKNNAFHVAGKGREVIAIDGSSENLIADNDFSMLADGGIFLYRNCGELGLTRQSTPSRNQLINNFFFYDRYGGAAIFVGSRDGGGRWPLNYCWSDDDARLGSGVDNRSHATCNVIMQNQILKRPVNEAILQGDASASTPNFIAHNTTVEAKASRRAGCFLHPGYVRNFILDGESAEIDVPGNPACRVGVTCSDGMLVRGPMRCP